MTAESSDRLLVGRLLRGDEGAFSQFFDASFDPLFRLAVPDMGDDEDAAEEVVQATLCRAVRTLDTWRAEAPLLAWLTTICRREIAAYSGERKKAGGDRAGRVRSAVHAEWQADTTRRAKKRVFTALGVAAALLAIIVFFNWPRPRTAEWGGGSLRIDENTRITLRSPKVALLDEIDSGLDIDAVREVADKNYELLRTNPRHPSLHFKRVGDLWSVRAGIHHRALGMEVPDGIMWIWIGTHGEYDKLIG